MTSVGRECQQQGLTDRLRPIAFRVPLALDTDDLVQPLEAQGAGPLDSDIRVPTFAGDAFISSQARALLENLATSRGNLAERRTLGTTGVEAWLERFISFVASGFFACASRARPRCLIDSGSKSWMRPASRSFHPNSTMCRKLSSESGF